VLLVYVMTARLLAKTRIVVRGGRVRVSHSFPWSGKRDVAVGDVVPLRVEPQVLPPRNSASVPTWNLVGRDGTVLVDGLADEEAAKALAGCIEDHVAAPVQLAVRIAERGSRRGPLPRS